MFSLWIDYVITSLFLSTFCSVGLRWRLAFSDADGDPSWENDRAGRHSSWLHRASQTKNPVANGDRERKESVGLA